MGPLSESNRVYNVRHLEGGWRWLERGGEGTWSERAVWPFRDGFKVSEDTTYSGQDTWMGQVFSNDL